MMRSIAGKLRDVALEALNFVWQPDGGGVAVLFALALIPIVGFGGVGIDAARIYLTKARLSSALDAAGLAGGASFFLPSRDDDIRMFFAANFPPNYMGATVSGPTIVADDVAETLTLSASATISNTFMSLFGFDNQTVSASAEITRQMQALDVALSIDMSGSMTWAATGGGTRIAAARAAANELIDILFGTDASKEKLNVGLVPWNSKVNVTGGGAAYDPALTVSTPVSAFVNPVTGTAQAVVYSVNNSPVPLLSAPPASWKGCVFNRFINDNDDASDGDIVMGPFSSPAADWPAWEPIGPEGEPVSGWGVCSMAAGGSECQPCLGHGITPLTNQKQAISDAVNALLNPTGSTNIPQGLGWAWRVVKPDAPFTEAIANPPYKRQQAIILLTDGENVGGSGDGYKAVFGLNSAAQAAMDTRLTKLAAAVKADGVQIYVIQFANAGSALQTLLQSVASSPDAPYYYYAPDADTLRQVFREVANHLSELRLSK